MASSALPVGDVVSAKCVDPATPSTAASRDFDASAYFQPFAAEELGPLASEQSAEGQAYRESLLKGACFLIVCGGSLNKAGHYKSLKELYGCRFVVLDEKSTTTEYMRDSGICEAVIEVDMTPRASMVDECVAAIEEYIQETRTVIRGVFTLWDDAVTLHARVAHRFGMPANSIAAVDIAHDKRATRRALESAGLTTPPHAKVFTEEQLLEASARIGFPCVLKPVSGAASLGVYIVYEEKDLLPVFRKAKREALDCYESGDLMGLVFEDCDADVAATSADLHCLLLEGFIAGPEVDVDIILQGGEVRYIMVSDDWPLVEPYLTEFGHNCPSQLPSETQDELRSMALACCRAFGLDNGAFHVELKQDPKLGSCLIELNPRMGGGGVRYMHRYGTGVDLGVESLFCSCNVPSRPIIHEKPLSYTTSHEYFVAKTGVCEKDSRIFLEEIMATMPSIKAVEGNLLPGDKVTCREEGFPSALGRLVVSSTSPAESYALGEYVRHLVDKTYPISKFEEQRD